ncbi:hypothetical protein [Paenibacillus flagellatus]|uniref:Uncharacterized protein n=1 Tax=Paenibacillus flagellatus TaxID=2211139 RepID=A0A2V5KFJ6_9BACL|nr:hypothetical protein [Paenibacillus flagellatus]PYI52850.1 hypothetical protein DLM86_17725 [Paenibacillus flagellatus]
METRIGETIYTEAAEPCRNFCILGVTPLLDPKDGREKLVLSNFAAGSVGNLVFVDTESGEGESIPLPGDSGAWALLALGDRLLVGTCPDYGYLHSLDLRTREWAEPLRIDSETYIWNFALGSDGMVYGGTYPGCALLRYDPGKHELTSVGRVSDNAKNLYSRNVYGGVPGRILVDGGFDEPFLRAWNIAAETFEPFGSSGETIRAANESFVCTEADGSLRFYDANTLQPVEGAAADEWELTLEEKETVVRGRLRVRFVRLRDGSRAGVKGQDYFVLRPGADEPVFRPIPVPAPATRIHTVIADGDGVLWGSSGFGQTIFRYDPRDGSSWNSGAVCDAGGEVYGMAFVGGELFMAAYAGGDHIVYRPDEPWDPYGNVNPRTLRSVGPELIRPRAKTVVGPDGGIWTGWAAKYGVYGGGLSRIDPATKEVASWYDPVPGQQLCGLAADGERLYFTTDTGGNGLAARDEPCHFAVWEPSEGRVTYLHRFEPGERPGFALAADSRVWVCVGTDIAAFDPASTAFVGRIGLGERCGCLLAAGSGRIAAFGEKTLYWIDTATMTAEAAGPLPGHVSTAARTPDGTVYFNCYGTKLYRLNAPVPVPGSR